MFSFWLLAGVEVSNWAGKAIMRKGNSQGKPPPPVRRSSSVTTSMNGANEKHQGHRVSKPPVISPKPKMSLPNDSRSHSRASSSSATSIASEPFPSPPPQPNHDEEGGCSLHHLPISDMRHHS